MSALVRAVALAAAAASAAALPPAAGAPASLARLLATAGLNASMATHHCVVTSDFNATANMFSYLFNVPPPIGKVGLHPWVWYRGQIIDPEPKALLIHVPLGAAGANWTLEIITPIDDQPSLWRELLNDMGNTVQHFGIVIEKYSFDRIQAVFDAAGYPAVQKGQGTWGCYSYHDLRANLGTVIELLDEGNLNCTKPT